MTIKLEELINNLIEKHDLKSIKIISKNHNIMKDYINILTGMEVDNDYKDIIYYDHQDYLNIIEAYSYKFIILKEKGDDKYIIIDKDILDYPKNLFID